MCIAVWTAISNPLDFDSAYNLNVARNLSKHGLYATSTYEGYQMFDSNISTGPTVILPISMAFSLLGIDLWVARLVMVGYLALFIAISFFTISYLLSRRTAILSVVLFLTTNAFFEIGTGVLGEIPALCFLLGGILSYHKFLTRKDVSNLRSMKYALLSGMLWGLAILTKRQFVFVILAVVLCFLLDRLWARKLPKYSLVPLGFTAIPLALWLLYQTSQVGLIEAIASDFCTPPSVAWQLPYSIKWPKIIIVLDAKASLERLFSLFKWANPLTILALAYLFYLARQPSKMAIQVLIAFILVWSAWWIFLNNTGWFRQAWPAIVLSEISIAKLGDDSLFIAGEILRRWIGGIQTSYGKIQRFRSPWKQAKGLVLIILGFSGLVFAAKTAYSTSHTFLSVREEGVKQLHAQLQMAEYIKINVEPDAVINGVGWQMGWEIAFLSGRTFRNLVPNENIIPFGSNSKPEYVLVTPLLPVESWSQAVVWPKVRYFLSKNATLVYRTGQGWYTWSLYRITK